MPSVVNENASLDERAKHIRRIFHELGWEHSSLARYLASRIDLLPAEFCREFSLIPDAGAPLSATDAQQIVEEEFGPGPGGVLVHNFTFDHSTLITSSYKAKLASGAPVVVTVLRPECSARLREPGGPRFNKALVQTYCGDAIDDDAFTDFFASLRRKSDFAAQRELLELLAYDTIECDGLAQCKIHTELSSNRVITLEQVDGLPLNEIISGRVGNAEVWARRLCQVWLWQALRGNGFAVDPQVGNITLVGNAVLFTGYDFTGLPPSTKENLWNYFMAIMADDPDRTAMYLLREMRPAQKAIIDSETFRSRFRQSASFGALEPLVGTNSNAVAQLVFQHWKTAREYGYLPSTHLLCFYRGLFSMARIAHELSPFQDSLREGLEEVRADNIVQKARTLLDWQYWVQDSDKFATALVTLPTILDDALTRESALEQWDRRRDDQLRNLPNRHSGTADSLAVFLLLVALLLFQISSVHLFIEKAGIFLVFLAGWMVLRKLTT